MIHSLNAYMTQKCNQKCVFCTGHRQRTDAEDFSAETLDAVCDLFPSIRSVCVAGLGEPTLAKTTPEVIRRGYDRGLFVSLISNGAKLAELSHRVDLTKLGYLSVSINDSDPDRRAALVGVDNLESTENTILRLLDQGVNLGVSFVVLRSKLPLVSEWLSWCAGMGVNFVSLVARLPSPGESMQDWSDEALFLEDEVEVSRMKALAANLGVNVNAWPVLLHRNLTKCPFTCRSPYETIGVDGDGNVSGCQRILGPSEHFGNIFLDGVEVLNGGHYRTLRAKLEYKDTQSICARCFGSWQ